MKYGKLMGEGSDRKVYAYGRGKVIKVSKNGRGNMQCKAEWDLWWSFTNEERNLFAKIYEYGVNEDGSNYIVMERLFPLDSHDMCGISLTEEQRDIFFAYETANDYYLACVHCETNYEQEVVEKYFDLMDKYDLGDEILDWRNMGVRKNGQIVPLDYGWIMERVDKWYS